MEDDTIEIVKKLETKKRLRHLVRVFAKCNAPDTTETGRRANSKVRMRIRVEDVKLRKRSGKVADNQRSSSNSGTIWNTRFKSSHHFIKTYYDVDKHMLSELLKSSCYTQTDSKHLFFVREEHLG